jgi:hypothetical protein
MREKILHPDQREISEVIINLAEIYRKQNRLDESE